MLPLLLAMQAAGMVTDYVATKNQIRLGELGAKLQQESIESNIQQTRLETEDASLQALRNLRQNLGTQMAVYAARGTSTANGSAVLSTNESVGNFNSDERMRRMNLISRENTLKGQGSIYKLNQEAEKAKLWKGFASRTVNTFPTSEQAWSKGIGDFKSSFGLTNIGGA